MSKAAASRIQSATAKTNGGNVPKSSISARAQSAATSNNTTPNGPSTTGKPSGGGRRNNPPKGKQLTAYINLVAKAGLQYRLVFFHILGNLFHRLFQNTPRLVDFSAAVWRVQS
jgi:hypothetical protein